MAVNYVTDYAYYSPGNYMTPASTTPTTDHRVMLQIGLRTIGATSFNAAQ